MVEFDSKGFLKLYLFIIEFWNPRVFSKILSLHWVLEECLCVICAKNEIKDRFLHKKFVFCRKNDSGFRSVQTITMVSAEAYKQAHRAAYISIWGSACGVELQDSSEALYTGAVPILKNCDLCSTYLWVALCRKHS